jgi:hypothetical protein
MTKRKSLSKVIEFRKQGSQEKIQEQRSIVTKSVGGLNRIGS